ncbi:hypothetical protein [Hymenobacter cheonanensis]|uniref:hypothetical protein n=1 Tax=Hymenobacter sp. CA2-7 TaxID=3063993 RepID=UPI0027129DD3|nr:hypothetical protein [Hymenobacter sp. CA2-7]MDO7883887.1 hypothetical protein [Hymenobacter sp. CA2-7]
MPKPDRKPDPDFEPDYDTPDADYDELGQDREHEVADPDYELAADPDYEEGAQADYEPGADPDYDEAPQLELVAATPAPGHLVRATSGFAFELGRPVVPATQQQAHPIVWRGLLKERHPQTGLVQRVPVYRLADGYWDCYREEELQVA